MSVASQAADAREQAARSANKPKQPGQSAPPSCGCTWPTSTV